MTQTRCVRLLSMWITQFYKSTDIIINAPDFYCPEHRASPALSTPHGLCHFTVNARNLANDRPEVPASHASRVVKWVRMNNFFIPCIYLEVQKLCCLHYNVLLHIPGLEPYPTPLPLSNFVIPLA